MAAVPSIGADMTRDLYERYSRQIYAYCLHQLGNREEAEDAVQTTFMNAFRGLQRGVVPELESAWLYKIANNVILTRRRSTFRRRRVETPGDLDALQDLLPAPQRDRDELMRLQEALREMPPQQQKALLLREWQGLSYREIGERLELSQSAVETLLFRARRTLAAGLTEAPAETKQRSGLARLRSGLDLSALLGAVKALLSGGAAVKVAVTAAAVATTAVTADHEIARHHVRPEPSAPVVASAAAAVPHPHASVAAAVAPSGAKRVVTAPVARHVRHSASPGIASATDVPVPVVAAASTPAPTATTTAAAPTPVVAPEPTPSATTTTAATAPAAPAVAEPVQDRGRGKSADAPGQQQKTESTESSTPPANEQGSRGRGAEHGKPDATPVVPAAAPVTTAAAPDPTTPVVTTPAPTDQASTLVPTTTVAPPEQSLDHGRGRDGRGVGQR